MSATETIIRPAGRRKKGRYGLHDVETAKPSPARWVGKVVAWLVIAVFIAFFVVPMVWLMLAPTQDPRELLLGHPFSFGGFDTLASNWNELMAFQDGIVWVWLGNATLYSGVALILTLLVSIPAGYALAMVEFRFRKTLLAVTLIVMLIPNTALVLPIFLELSALKLVGTPLSVILPFSFYPFGVYLTYIYFSTAVSRDLLNAARIDGAGEFRVFAQVAMPLATPVVALVGCAERGKQPLGESIRACAGGSRSNHERVEARELTKEGDRALATLDDLEQDAPGGKRSGEADGGDARICDQGRTGTLAVDDAQGSDRRAIRDRGALEGGE